MGNKYTILHFSVAESVHPTALKRPAPSSEERPEFRLSFEIAFLSLGRRSHVFALNYRTRLLESPFSRAAMCYLILCIYICIYMCVPYSER